MPLPLRWIVGTALGFLLTFGAARAWAVTCTITGSVAVEPLDGYYCDTNHEPSCAGWKVVDLDSARGAAAKRLPYMRIEIWQGSTFVGKTHSVADGTYTASFTLPGATCAGQVVQVQHWMQRIHEADLNAGTKRYRFSVVVYQNGVAEADMLTIWKPSMNVTLTGSSTSVATTFTAGSALSQRLANMYFIANSAITEIVTWTTGLSNSFAHTSGGSNGIFRILFGPDYGGNGGNAGPQTWLIRVGYDTYNLGSIVRHELGHIVREASHNRQCYFNGCSSYGYNYNWGIDMNSCEYGSAAFNEGIATFFGVRSATGSDTNVWDCGCADDANQDTCSEAANAPLGVDGIGSCSGAYQSFIAIGDRWITSSSACKRLRVDGGCNCTVGGDGFCANSVPHGWRSIVQVPRFLWDMIDTSSDNGFDDTDLGTNQFVDLLASMPTGFGVDGSCRESERSNPAQCNPAIDGAPVTGGTGSRDAYNPRDMSDLIPGDQSWEMTINCVGLATDY